MKRYLYALVFLITLTPGVSAALIHGNVYDLELNTLNQAVVEINTVPKQVMVSRNGTYEFNVLPGNYFITATHAKLDLLVQENVTVKEEGSFVLDLILFPDLAPEEELLNETVDVPEYEEPEAPTKWWLWALFGIGIAALIILWHRRRKQPKEEKKELAKADLEELIAIVRKEGGRITQKDLRRALPYSEAKISLMISELEAVGKIKKIKKGRGNILILP